MIGPLSGSWRPLLHINRFGLIPKGHDSGKLRLITDLSFLYGACMNEGINTDLVSLYYIAVDDMADILQELSKGALFTKMDIEAAYRLLPAHSQDRILQGGPHPSGYGMGREDLCRALSALQPAICTKDIYLMLLQMH